MTTVCLEEQDLHQDDDRATDGPISGFVAAHRSGGHAEVPAQALLGVACPGPDMLEPLGGHGITFASSIRK